MRVIVSLVFLCVLTGCSKLERLSEIGQAPRLSTIKNPTANPNYAAVNMPMPAPKASEQGVNSLWKAGARSFFKDQRAKEIGDILTVDINFNETANMTNSAKRSRATKEKTDVNIFPYLGTGLNKVIPGEFTNGASTVLDWASNPTHDGKGDTKRSEALNVKMAATVIQTLPNGNLVINGRQEVRVNNEVRELLLTGIVRPQDITSRNIVSYEKIAEARISYGGRGEISDVIQPPWGQQVIDIISPF